MAAPNGTTWGNIVSSKARIGLYTSLSNTNTQTTVNIEVWFWSKYSVHDSSNNYYFNNESSSASTNRGAVNIYTNVSTGSGWSTSNQQRIATYSYKFNRGTGNSTKYCAAKLTGIDVASGTMTVSRSYTIPALASYKVSYNANGGSGAPSSQTKYYGTTLKLSSTKPTRTGYSFQGWGTSAGDTSVDYAAGANYTANASITLYAIWKANTYTVTYDANGGDNAPVKQTKTYGVTLVLTSDIPTRTNYNFLGWGTSAASTTIAYNPGDNYTTNTNTTLYAIWELAYLSPILSNIRLDRCKSDGTLSDEGTYGKISFNWEVDATIPDSKPSWGLWYIADSMNVAGGSPSGTSGTVSSVIQGPVGGWSTEESYLFSLTFSDGSTTADTTDFVKEITLPSMKYLIDFLAGGNGVRIGAPANRQGFRDQFNTVFSNGCANLNFTAEDILDPDITLESLIVTNVNTPNTGYMYIHTMFNESKETGSNRSQIAIPYNSVGSTYHRYYYNGMWSRWEKNVTESELQLEHGSGVTTNYLVGSPELYWNKFGHICVISLAFQVNSDGVAGDGTIIATGFPKAWYQTQMGVVTQGVDSSNALGVDTNGNLRVWYLRPLTGGYTYRGSVVYICQ